MIVLTAGQVILRVAASHVPPSGPTVPPSAAGLPPGEASGVRPAGTVSTSDTWCAVETLVALVFVAVTVYATSAPGATMRSGSSTVLVAWMLGSTIVVEVEPVAVFGTPGSD